jgi:hypothetical protein
MSCPNTSTVPLVLLTSEVTMPMAVVLPAQIDGFERFDAVSVDLDELAKD